MRLAWLAVMNECSTRRSARLRWLGSEACFCCSRQNSTSGGEARPVSSTSLPTSVSRFAANPEELLSACDIARCSYPTLSPLEDGVRSIGQRLDEFGEARVQ